MQRTHRRSWAIKDSCFRELVFNATVDSPGSWIFRALDLKTAAHRIHPELNPVQEDEPSLGLIGVYWMLLGMSFEALLKGILVAHGEQVLNGGKLAKSFTTHDLKGLAQKAVDVSSLVLSPDELVLLEFVTPYVVWAGRYPLPKTADDMMGGLSFSHTQDRPLRELWDRLYEHLRSIGWVIRGGGKRLYLDKSRRGQSGP
jgi:hypothetical protein